MKIYTKSGDQGETSLWGGGRVMKSHPRVNAYGTVDEANSMIGLAVSFVPEVESVITSRLIRIQNELFQVGSELATQIGAKNSCPFVGDVQIAVLEQEIDEMESALVPLQNFILPNGSAAGSALHLARTIVRRSERECVDLSHSEPLRQELIRYLNRLSDYLFVMARFVNQVLGKSETKWIPPKSQG
jgi:cob(I)alamin adenosyltransferase